MRTQTKQRRITALMMALVIMLGMLSGLHVSFPAFAAGGEGTKQNPYIIETAAELDAVRNDLSAHYRLGGDIDLTGYLSDGGEGYEKWGVEGWQPIGTASSPFTGSFDGNGHKIIGLWINCSGYAGLFERTSGVLQNLGVEIDDGKGGVIGNNDVGGLVGYQAGGSIENCYATGGVTGNFIAGGLVGNQAGHVSITASFFDIDASGMDATQGVGNTTSATGVTGLTTEQMTALNVLESGGAMESLGSAFVKPNYSDNMGCAPAFYPELSVFADLADEYTETMSKISVVAGSVCDITGTNEQYFVHGDGASDATPYQIWTAEQLNHVRQHLGDELTHPEFKLMCDINLGGFNPNDDPDGSLGYGWQPIGASGSGKYFTGTFDGSSHKITGLWINRTTNNTGLFGYASEATIKELGVVINDNLGGVTGGNSYTAGLVGQKKGGNIKNCYSSGSVTGKHSTGGLVGYHNGGTITGCHTEGTVNGGSSPYASVGGLVGKQINSCEIIDCYSNCDVTGYQDVGGLIGVQTGSSITNCYATGKVTGTGNYTGGLVGTQFSGSSITGSYATGDVSSERLDSYGIVGGLVAYQYTNSTVKYCYATGNVSTKAKYPYAGGLVGDQNSGSITNSFATGNIRCEISNVGILFAGGLVANSNDCIENCYSKGNVVSSGSGTLYTGGLVGRQNSAGSITNSYAAGGVTGSGEIGGLVGRQLGSINNGYYDEQISGQENGVGNDPAALGVTGLTTAQMVSGGALETGGAISALGTTEWKKRASDNDYCYYPELATFYEGTAEQQAASKTSVTVDRRTPVLSGVTASEITYGQTLGNSTLNGTAKDSATNSDVAGAFAWSDGTIEPAVSDSQTTNYGYTFTPDYTDLYKTVSGTTTVKVNKASVTVSVFANPNQQTRPGSVTLSASGLPDGATGKLTFKQSGIDIGSPVNVGETMTFTASGPVDSYAFTVTYSGDENYNSSTSDSLNYSFNKGTQADLNFNTSPSGKTYGDSPFTITATGGSGTGEITYVVVSGPAAVNGNTVTLTGAGTVKLKAVKAADDDYYEKESNIIEISVAKAVLTVTAEDKSKNYNEANPALTFAYGGFVNGEDENALTTTPAISTTADEDSNAGTYPIILSGGAADNYEFEYVQGTLTVNSAGQAAFAITQGNLTKTYGDAGFRLTTTGGSGDGAVTWQSGDPTVASVDNAGNVTIHKASGTPVIITATKAGGTNYEDTTAEIAVTVNKAVLTVTAEDKSKNYNEANPALTFVYSGFVNGEDENALTTTPAISTAADEDSNAGTYPIILSGGAAYNYKFEFTNASLTVTAAGTARVSVKSIPDQIYTGSQIKPALTVKDGDKVLQAGTDYDAVYRNNINAGMATVTITLKGNYTGTINANFTIKQESADKCQVELNANGGKFGNGKKSRKFNTVKNKAVGKLTAPKRKGYTFLGWYTKKTGGKKITAKTIIKKDTTLYAHWGLYVKLRANGGKFAAGKAVKTLDVTKRKKIVKLPVPKRKNCVFLGWYTKKTGGKEVKAGFPVKKNTTLYAHWGTIGVVNTRILPLRLRKGAWDVVVATYPKGTKVIILGSSGDWYKVRVGDRTGYMHKRYIRIL